MSDPGSAEAEVSTRLPEAFDRHYRHLVALGGGLTANQEEAEDIVQDAFVRVAPRIASLHEAEERPYAVNTLYFLHRRGEEATGRVGGGGG